MAKAQPLILSQWIFSIVLAVIIFPSERNMVDMILVFISIITIFVIFTSKHHFEFNKYSIMLLASTFMMASHSIIVKMLLDTFSAFEIYFIRILFSFVIFFISVET